MLLQRMSSEGLHNYPLLSTTKIWREFWVRSTLHRYGLQIRETHGQVISYPCWRLKNGQLKTL